MAYGYDGLADEDDDSNVMGAIARPQMRGIGAIGEVAAPNPTPGFPVTGDPRQSGYKWPDGSLVNGPDQVQEDARKLRVLNYAAPDTGNAYDPLFQRAVAAFQRSADLATDGLIGPDTRGELNAAYDAQGGGGGPIPNGGGGGGGGGLLRTSSGSSDNTMLYVGLGIGGLVLAGLGWFALKS